MSDITLTFPDGAKRSFAKGITGKALAESISKSLAKKAVAMRDRRPAGGPRRPDRQGRRRQDRHPHRSRKRWS